MPTSSQFLILQTHNGYLPPIFGRRPKRSPDNTWSVDEYHMHTAQLKTDSDVSDVSDVQRYRKSNKPFAWTKSGQISQLKYKIDFSTLPQLLNIRGIHGSLAYNSSTSSLHWKINAIGPFYDRIHRVFSSSNKQIKSDDGQFYTEDRLTRPYTDPQKHYKTPTFQYFHADRAHDIPEEKSVGVNGSGNEDYVYPTTYMRIKDIGGDTILQSTDGQNAGYFKLVPVTLAEGAFVDNNLFQLEKCNPNESGSFRLSPTDAGEVGQFRLVPHPGFVANDFRLVPSSDVKGAFVLLQSELKGFSQYIPVQRNKDSPEEFKLIQAKRTDNNKAEIDVSLPREAWPDYYSVRESQYDLERSELTDTTDFEAKFGIGNRQTKIYQHEHAASFRNSHNINNPKYSMTADNESSTNQRETSMQHIRQTSKHVQHNAPESNADRTTSMNNNTLDSRAAYDEADKHIYRYQGADVKMLDSAWKMSDFEQWRRTGRKDDRTNDELTNGGTLSITSTSHSIGKQEESSKQIKFPFLDDAKNMEKFKLWKKKKNKFTRMRKELPPPDPKAVCVRLNDNAISHQELKKKIEEAVGCELVSLQFDPVFVHSVDSEMSSRWVLRFPDVDICKQLTANGLILSGVTYEVRSYDDVMKEENETFKFFQIMKEMAEMKAVSSNSKRSVKKSQNLKSMQTQTNKNVPEQIQS